MTKRAALFGILIVFVVTSGCILSAQKDSGNMPPGVSPAKWVPLTETSGVLLREPVLGRERTLDHGILMVKVHNIWREVHLDDSPGGFMPVKP